MKGLKIILGIIYPILIILLLLSNCNRHKAGESPENSKEESRTVKEEQVDTTQVDTDTVQVDTAQAVREARNTGQTGDLKVTCNPQALRFTIHIRKMLSRGEPWMLTTEKEVKGLRKTFFGPIPPRGSIKCVCTFFKIKAKTYQARVYARWWSSSRAGTRKLIG